MLLQGLNAIVTGGTSGIGREIARLFAQEGARVAIVGRHAERGDRVVREITETGGIASFYQTDVTREQDVNEMVENVVATYGTIDILINSAGVVKPGTITETSLEDWETIWQTNVTSIYLLSHAVIPHMTRQQSGSIVNLSSEAGLKGLKARAAYCTAKFAVVGITKAMAVDHSGDGIRINCLCPGTIETEMVQNLIASSPNPDETRRTLVDRRLTPFIGSTDEVARSALYLADPRNRYLTGAVLSVDGGAAVK